MLLHVYSKCQDSNLASVAEQAGLCLTWSPSPGDRFSHDKTQIIFYEFYWEKSLKTKEEYSMIKSVKLLLVLSI